MAKYGKAASKNVESAMRRRKKGTLKSGSGRKVKSRETGNRHRAERSAQERCEGATQVGEPIAEAVEWRKEAVATRAPCSLIWRTSAGRARDAAECVRNADEHVCSWPGAVSISSVPPTSAARSSMPIRPISVSLAARVFVCY